jgi:hypothetical protein
MKLNPKDIILLVAIAAMTVCLALFVAFPPGASAHTVSKQTCASVASIYPPHLRRGVQRNCVRLAAKHAEDHHCQRFDLTPFDAIDCIWPKATRPWAKRVGECESTASVSNEYARAHGLGRWSRNASGHWGIFQLGAPERAEYGPYRIGDDARVQVKSALGLYRARGAQPWVCQ